MKLEDRCSNNKAEQVAIHKALEETELLNRERISPLTVIIYTDSRVSRDSLRNAKNHSFLVEEIRKQVAGLERRELRIKFSCVKGHAGTLGNEMVDRLEKKRHDVEARRTFSP